MDKHEKLADRFLRSNGFEPEFEPLGNQTIPDFKIENDIAIEVRRLNQYVKVGNSQQPIEKFRYKLEPIIRSIAASIDYDPSKPSYYYHATYEREFATNRAFKRSLLKTFKDVLNSNKDNKKVQVNSKLTISFKKTTNFMIGILLKVVLMMTSLGYWYCQISSIHFQLPSKRRHQKHKTTSTYSVNGGSYW